MPTGLKARLESWFSVNINIFLLVNILWRHIEIKKQNYSSWRVGTNYIIVKVVVYVIGDCRGQSDGRLTRCSQRERVKLFFSYQFCARDFSIKPRLICMNFSGLIENHKNLMANFLFIWRHFRSRNIVDFVKFRGPRCPELLAKTI